MGKRLPSIDKNKARTFVLVHASGAGEDGKRVFKEITKNSVDVSLSIKIFPSYFNCCFIEIGISACRDTR
jgi:hypothetical protein